MIRDSMLKSNNVTRDPYLVKSIVHSSQLLTAFRTGGEALPLREIAARSGLPKTMAFRLLYTLEKCGFVEKVGENLYQSCLRPFKRKLHKLGYAGQGANCRFSNDIAQSLQQAAAAEGIELICLDNRYNVKVAQRNADILVRERVDLVIEYQTDETVAPAVATKYREAGIPFIAVEVPHPGATYFGGNNYEAGLIGGRHLGRWAKQHWLGEIDEFILIEQKRAGSLPLMRLTGTLAGAKAVLPQIESRPVTHLDGDGQFEASLEVTRKHLRMTRARRVLVGAVNDASALGALRAFEEAGRAECCAVMGQNASPEGRDELRQPRTRLIGSVAFFPERYGEGLVRLSLDILNHRPVPPAVFVKHVLITPETVDHHYPNDQLTFAACTAT